MYGEAWVCVSCASLTHQQFVFALQHRRRCCCWFLSSNIFIPSIFDVCIFCDFIYTRSDIEIHCCTMLGHAKGQRGKITHSLEWISLGFPFLAQLYNPHIYKYHGINIIRIIWVSLAAKSHRLQRTLEPKDMHAYNIAYSILYTYVHAHYTA